jgi:hypothetical protein
METPHAKWPCNLLALATVIGWVFFGESFLRAEHSEALRSYPALFFLAARSALGKARSAGVSTGSSAHQRRWTTLEG